jgi:GDSL-like lipase/acylhydrolase family protein
MPSKTNLALFIGSTLFCLFLGEMTLRVVMPANNFNPNKLYCEYDSLLGWRKIPNIEGKHKTEEYEVVEQINSMGIRGPEYSLEKDSGEYRILVIGDSFAEGYMVSFEDLFSEVMKDSLNKNCGNAFYQVVNTGTGGYSTDQEVLYFEKYGAAFNPDLTILMFCINDPWYNTVNRYWRGFKPMFTIEGDSLRLTNVPVPKPMTRSFYEKVKEWMLQHSHLVSGIKNLKDKVNYARDDQTVPEEFRIYKTSNPAEMAKSWQVTAALLDRMHRKASAAGSNFLVFYIPEKIEVFPDAWQQFLTTYSLDEQYFDHALPRRKLQSICDSLKIHLLDPAPVFVDAAKADPAANFYFKHDWHWNTGGNQLAGKILADSVGCAEFIEGKVTVQHYFKSRRD